MHRSVEQAAVKIHKPGRKDNLMHFLFAADTDIGISKKNNQDSVLVKHAASTKGEVLLAVICDGMGGLSKGELASATVIKAFSKWFDEELSRELENPDMYVIGNKWALMLKELNGRILEYGRQNSVSLGTTFSGILFADDKYVIAHVGDSRVYHLSSSLSQLTTDQTFIAREIAAGRMTKEQARTDRRRNMLLQCVGASKAVEPEILTGKAAAGGYLLCSDGFRHVNTPEEIYAAFSPALAWDKDNMRLQIRKMIDQAMQREERDNISAIYIKLE